MLINEKKQTRSMMTNLRKHLSREYQQQAAASVAAKLINLSAFIQSEHVGYYLAHQGELDPTPTIQCATHLNKKLYLPVIDQSGANSMQYYHYANGDPMQKNHFGIYEPQTQNANAFDLTKLDIVLTPLVSFDSQCNRLGHGAGFFDRTFAFLKTDPKPEQPILIGLAYDFQKVTELSPADWDVPLDFIITEKDVYQRTEE